MTKKSISLKDVLDFYIQLENLGIKIWIDGGFTRTYGDVSYWIYASRK